MTGQGEKRPGAMPFVIVDPAAIDTVATLARLGGATVERGWGGAALAGDGSASARVCVGTAAPGDEAAIVDLAYSGSGLVLAFDADQPGPSAELGDALWRMGDVEDWRGSPISALDPDQLDLLDAVAQGATVADAAKELYLSYRTAHRLIAKARATLGMSSTAEAARLVRSSVVRFSPDPTG